MGCWCLSVPSGDNVRLLESMRLAVHAIRSNPLRSILTVCGNVIAVSAIVTVVALIQGMNAMVSDAIVGQVGADAFTIQRVPFTRTDEDIERTRTNPLLTLEEAAAIRRYSRNARSVMAQAQDRGTVRYQDRTVEQVSLQGVTSTYLDFSTFDAERGRMMSAVEVDRGHPVALIGVDVTHRLFDDVDPLDKVIQVGGQHLRVVGVSKKKGGFLGVSLDSFVVVPLNVYTRAFGARPSLSLLVKPQTPDTLPIAIDEASRAAANTALVVASLSGAISPGKAKEIYAEVLAGKALATTPKTPPAVVKILRDSYEKAFKDAEFAAAVEKIQREPITLITGEEMQKSVVRLHAAFKKQLPEFKKYQQLIYDRYVAGK